MAVTDLFFGPLAATFLIGATTFVLLLWYSVKKQSYWKKRGLKYVTPLPFIGTLLENFSEPQHEVEGKRYKKYGEIYGHYEGNRPAISVADPKLLRDIFVKDFQHFSNRRTFYTGDNTMDKMVSNLEGEDWKRVRSIMTPTFSTGKLKRMMNIFKECSMTLISNFKAETAKGKSVNMKKTYGAMAMDVIASSAFSTKIDSHNDPENEFVRAARIAFGTSVTWRFLMFILFPSLMRFFRISVFSPKAMDFFRKATIQIIQERKRLGQTRNDFLQLLIDTAKEVSKEENWEEEKESDLAGNYKQEEIDQNVFKSIVAKKMSMEELVAQCVIFFIAGYDTTASTLSFATYNLALNEDVQEKAFQEIKKCLEESKGELTYEAVQKMKYLDNIISETLRLYPPATRLERKTESDYKLGDTGITIPKGMIVTIPNCAIHKDPKYFPEPEKFDPNRFTTEARNERDPYTYLPFGAGPRNCLGMRFALLEVKVCLIHVISHFIIKTCPETTIPLKFYSGVALLQPRDIFLKMEPRKDCPL